MKIVPKQSLTILDEVDLIFTQLQRELVFKLSQPSQVPLPTLIDDLFANARHKIAELSHRLEK